LRRRKRGRGRRRRRRKKKEKTSTVIYSIIIRNYSTRVKMSAYRFCRVSQWFLL
jgi:hypothetical protein